MEARDLSNTVDEGVNRLKTGVHEAMDKVAHATTQAGEALSEKSEQLHDVEQNWVKNCRGYVHKNPIVSLGMAVGIGFLLSRLFSSR
jgi:ElaB/YqjD/DUF883 family membrane-anchored ribosome-binding protein